MFPFLSSHEFDDDLPPLTDANIELEVAGVYEDLLNLEHGHKLTLPEQIQGRRP